MTRLQTVADNRRTDGDYSTSIIPCNCLQDFAWLNNKKSTSEMQYLATNSDFTLIMTSVVKNNLVVKSFDPIVLVLFA